MAGLIGLTSSDIELQDALRVARWEYEGQWIPHPVIRLTTTLPIAVNRDGQRVAIRARWGFNVGMGRPIGNARDDRLLESRLWWGLLKGGPCLFAATAIYEQIREPTKTSYWFRRRDQKPIVMPGLCGEQNVKGEKTLCAAIVTTTPNDFFRQYHDRQVCALSAKEFDRWMEPQEPTDRLKLLHASDSEEWEAVPVDDRIFSPGRREMEDLIPVGPPVRWAAAAAARRR